MTFHSSYNNALNVTIICMVSVITLFIPSMSPEPKG